MTLPKFVWKQRSSAVQINSDWHGVELKTPFFTCAQLKEDKVSSWKNWTLLAALLAEICSRIAEPTMIWHCLVTQKQLIIDWNRVKFGIQCHFWGHSVCFVSGFIGWNTVMMGNVSIAVFTAVVKQNIKAHGPLVLWYTLLLHSSFEPHFSPTSLPNLLLISPSAPPLNHAYTCTCIVKGAS